MFYRRKLILGLLEIFEGHLPKISLQKLLLLITQKQGEPTYDFVPYKFGCYSFSANADLSTMVKKGILSETKEQFSKVDDQNYFSQLKATDQKIIGEVKSQYGHMSANGLMRHTYINFPYWAIKSTKAREILNDTYMARVENQKPVRNDITLFTIGYEGISLEEYLNRLIRNDVKVLVDVRNNPKSMKFGFSQSTLRRYCESLGIGYVHFPEVGIVSEKRQTLESQADYDRLFEGYKSTTLKSTGTTQQKILNLLKLKQRIALTCFEAEICQCHRKHLAESITSLPEWEYSLQHI
ncbi:DUF488 domain-containing protein [Algoriphagus sp. AGSA1]|uniref:DUF488 domain-containing protein n=1 Tax=Algoriphagus sp. AGSA1 TaxID=2907213 RepID=UPI001F3D0820|nr:DUF488 domain-containing protein [Algoriphagus sp. AGSA1]MCE7056885.1 DUF488 domain-containing protein [Algoriphagus sp. AGSA1]